MRGSGRGQDGLLRAWPRPPMSCPVPRVEASPASTSAVVVEAETASQASEPASQASDEEDTPATDIYFVSPPGALSHHRALNPCVLMYAHSLTCPHTWTHIAHTIIPVYPCLYTCTCVHVFTSTHSRICTRSHGHGHAHTLTFERHTHLHMFSHTTLTCSYMPTALTWHTLEHMHTHMACELPASDPGQAQGQETSLGLAPQSCDHCLARAKAPALPPGPPGNHPSPHTLSPSGPLGPGSVLETLWIFSSWVRGGWVGSVLKGAREMWQGAGGPHAFVFPGRGQAAVPEQGGVHHSRKGPVPETGASLPNLGSPPPFTSPVGTD